MSTQEAPPQEALAPHMLGKNTPPLGRCRACPHSMSSETLKTISTPSPATWKIRRNTKTYGATCFSALSQEVPVGWYHALPPSSILSYEDLQQTFCIGFSHRKRERKDSGILLGVKQQLAKPLRDYLAHFSLSAQGVNDLQNHHGLKDCSFMRSLTHALVKTLAEATKRA